MNKQNNIIVNTTNIMNINQPSNSNSSNPILSSLSSVTNDPNISTSILSTSSDIIYDWLMEEGGYFEPVIFDDNIIDDNQLKKDLENSAQLLSPIFSLFSSLHPSSSSLSSICPNSMPLSLSQIDPLFFKEDFCITDYLSQQFDYNNQHILTETLSYLLDIVEINLIDSISVNKERIFNELLSIQDLYNEIGIICQIIKFNRAKIKELLQHIIDSPLSLISRSHRRHNCQQILSLLQSLKQSILAIHSCQNKIQQKDYISALEFANNCSQYIQNQKSRNLIYSYLDSLTSLSLSPFLYSSLSTSISSLLSLLYQDVISLILNAFSSTTLSLSTSSLSSLKYFYQIYAKIGLNALINLLSSLSSYFSSLILSKIDNYLINYLSLSSTQSIEKIIFSLSPQKCLNLSTSLFTFITSISHLLLQIFQPLSSLSQSDISYDSIIPKPNIDKKKNIYSFDDYQQHSTQLTQMTIQLLHHQIIHFFNHFDLSLFSIEDFNNLYLQCSQFLSLSEKTFSLKFFVFRQNILTLTSTFLTSFHKHHTEHLNYLLNVEKWKTVNVPYHFQNLLNDLFSSDQHEHWDQSTDVPFLTLSDRNYPVSPTILSFLKIIKQYISLTFTLPFIQSDTFSFIGQLFTLYHSRSHHLILQAGIMKSSGFKSVSARHLSVSALCILFLHNLSFLIIEYIHHLTPSLPESISLFEQIQKNYLQHFQQIIDKLSSLLIMSLVKLKENHEYLNNFFKDMNSLNKVCLQYFLKSEMRQIYQNLLSYLFTLSFPSTTLVELHSYFSSLSFLEAEDLINFH